MRFLSTLCAEFFPSFKFQISSFNPAHRGIKFHLLMSDNDKIDFSGFLDDYLNDAKEGFQEVNSALLALEKDYTKTGLLDEVFRVVHTLKSSSTMLEFSNIAELAHTFEDFLDRLRKKELPVTREAVDLMFEVIDALELMVKDPIAECGMRIAELKEKIISISESEIQSRPAGPKSEIDSIRTPQSKIEDSAIRIPHSAMEMVQTVRVNVDLLDSLFNLAGELIITKNRLDNIIADTEDKVLKATLVAMGRMIGELQENVSAARLVPADEIFQKFPRMVRDLAREQNKEVELILEGGAIELDKAVLDEISEPLIHLLRNAVDHGIEPDDIRREQGKKMPGTIKLAAKRTENRIIIDVEDDGAGIDVARMREVAIAKGFIRPEETESLRDKEVLNLLFEPGFSSTEEVTGLSGRGVGLDVVRTSAKKMGGTVEAETQKGKGTRFNLELPLTTSVMQTLMVGVGEHLFAIPSDIVLETLEIRPGDLKGVRQDRALVLRNEVIPFVELNELLNIPIQEDRKQRIAVIIYRGDRFMALGVDTLLDQIENIIKPFDPIAQQFKGFSGGTILGDGRVALLLDVPGLLKIEELRD